MDPLGVVSMALEFALEAKREETRRMEESLRDDSVAFVDKVKERSRLMTRKQDLIAKEAPKEKFADEFMIFMEAVENGDLKNFDEKGMLNTVSEMMESEYEQGGTTADAGEGTNNVGNGP